MRIHSTVCLSVLGVLVCATASCGRTRGGAVPDSGADATQGTPDATTAVEAGGTDTNDASAGGVGADAGGIANTLACKAGVPVRSTLIPVPAPAAGLPAGITGVFPATGAIDVCADATLRIAFSQAPSASTVGKVEVWKVGVPDVLVQTLDLSLARFTTRVGAATKNYWPFFTDGNVMSIVLPNGVLMPGTTYYVIVDQGAFTSATGEPLSGITDPNSWRFTTAAAAPVVGTDITVATDGTGDFCSVQGAIDALPVPNPTPRVITLKKGIYHGLVSVVSKANVTLRGEDRKESVIAAANNDRCNSGSPGRVLMEVSASPDFVLENLTLHNQTVQVGTGDQAETLFTRSDRVTVRAVDFISIQDTLRLDGHVYLVDSYIEGATDFIWGNGVAFFDTCEIRTVVRRGYNVQARNLAGSFGYVFVNSAFTSDVGITGHFLGRTNSQDPAPASHVAYVDCKLGSHISPAGWLTYPSNTSLTNLRFWEIGSTDLAGNPLDTSMRIGAANKKPSSTDGGVSMAPIDDTDVTNMRNPAFVLAPWSPLGTAVPDAGAGDAAEGN